jgi:hypothetical protein
MTTIDESLLSAYQMPQGSLYITAALADILARLCRIEEALSDVLPRAHGIDHSAGANQQIAVLLRRRGLHIDQTPMIVSRQTVLDAGAAVRALAQSNWCFVRPDQVAATLSELA